MELTRRRVLHGAATATAFGVAGGLAGCTTSASSAKKHSLTLSPKAWKYDAKNDVYYQLGKYYVAAPEATDYESLGVYVPGKYFTATENANGTYTATVHAAGTVGEYTARTAPIVFPVDTPGYAAQKPPTSYSYSDVSAYIEAGFVYVAPGLRGRDSNTSSYTGNAPWGVTDLKAAVRYIRYNLDAIPGDTGRMVVFGMSGGGAQSAIAGASGDSALYTPYLKKLGAAMNDAAGKKISDAVAGAMCWCPITNLDYGNAAYEWNMGQFASTGTRASGTWTAAYSKDLTTAFAHYVNALGLKDTAGTKLRLSPSSNGEYLSGSYYDFVVAAIEKSLNRFLSYTTFPYTPTSMSMGGAGGGAPSGGGSGAPSGGMSGAPTGGGSGAPSGGMSGAPSGGMSGAPTGGMTGAPPGGTTGGASSGSTSSKTYKTVEAYIDFLNTTSTWVSYDEASKTATVLNLRGFVKSQKNASKDVGAFDGVSRNATENVVFGKGTAGLHFSPIAEKVIAANQARYATLTGWKSTYGSTAYKTDFAKSDAVGKNAAYRVDMFNPMYFLTDFYAGFKTSKVAPHWRIRTGIQQGDTANTTELNLTAALENLGKEVDFATVWGEGHTMAEETGSSTTNFISWVKDTIK